MICDSIICSLFPCFFFCISIFYLFFIYIDKFDKRRIYLSSHYYVALINFAGLTNQNCTIHGKYIPRKGQMSKKCLHWNERNENGAYFVKRKIYESGYNPLHEHQNTKNTRDLFGLCNWRAFISIHQFENRWNYLNCAGIFFLLIAEAF